MGEDDDAVELLSQTVDFGSRYADVTAWEVPESERYPGGIKYSMQYGNAAGETIIRYDNFPDHPGVTHHHKHTEDGEVEAVEFEGASSSLRTIQTRGERAWRHLVTILKRDSPMIERYTFAFEPVATMTSKKR